MSTLPKLDEEIVAAAAALGDAIDKVLLRSEDSRRLSRGIRRRQGGLLSARWADATMDITLRAPCAETRVAA